MGESLQQIQPGQLIADRYRLEEPIGRGAMGAVWRAVHTRLESPVAIKLLNSTIADDPEMLERFLREARSAAAVRSSHVVQIFDYGVDGDTPYIAMELLVGEPLDERLDARGVLEPAELDKIFSEIARAVSNAHAQGVVHRDIKPANIFIAREGDLEVTKVLDFGIAKLLDQRLAAPVGSGTHTGNILGTPNYMSPEQARGQRQVDHRSDLWSLAVLAFECLTGRQPFESTTLGDLVVKICTAAPTPPSTIAPVPEAFDAWFLRGVSKDPAGRFRSALEMADELHALLSAEGLGADSRQRSSTDRRFPPDKIDPARAARERASGSPAGAAVAGGGATVPGAGAPLPSAADAAATVGETARGAHRGPTLLTSTGAIATEVLRPAGTVRRARYAVAGLLLVAAGVLALGPGRAWLASSAPVEVEPRRSERAAADGAATGSAALPVSARANAAAAPEASEPTANPAPEAAVANAGAADGAGASASAAPAADANSAMNPSGDRPPAAAPESSAARSSSRTASGAREASASKVAVKPPRNPKPPRVERPASPQMPVLPAQPAAPKPAAPAATPEPKTPFDPYSDRL